MLFNDTIRLVSFTDSSNEMGDPVRILFVGEEVFAGRQSVKRSEFYQAVATGLKPEIVFIIRTVEYNSEPLLKYGTKMYNIIRAYEKDTEFIELVCSGVVNVTA